MSVEQETENLITQIIIHDERASLPTRAHPDDVGYDLRAICWSKSYGHTTLYDTGISVKPPTGYYFKLVPRSSLSKTGYVLANSPGTNDPNYRGTLKIALKKVIPESPSLEAPFTLCQMTLERVISTNFERVDAMDDTERGDGGFGSTGDR